VFTPEDRQCLRERLIGQARSDYRVVAAAAVGSSASGGDRWSDLDLTFGVAEAVTVDSVLDDWTRTMEIHFHAVTLFDLSFMSTTYRVFLLPGNLQVDLSFTNAAEFGALGPKFHLLFGKAVERPAPTPSSNQHMLGLGVHHAVRAHICIQRGRL
jgi:hypothetical protein